MRTHGGRAEGAGGLRLQHGPPQEPPADLGPPAQLDHWRVACPCRQPVVVVRRTGLARAAEGAQRRPAQALRGAEL